MKILNENCKLSLTLQNKNITIIISYCYCLILNLINGMHTTGMPMIAT